MAKKIKVRLLPKVNSYRLDDISYKPGDEFEIPSRLFRPDFFEKVVPPEKKPTPPPPEPEEEEPIEEGASSPYVDLSEEPEAVSDKKKGKKGK